MQDIALPYLSPLLLSIELRQAGCDQTPSVPSTKTVEKWRTDLHSLTIRHILLAYALSFLPVIFLRLSLREGKTQNTSFSISNFLPTALLLPSPTGCWGCGMVVVFVADACDGLVASGLSRVITVGVTNDAKVMRKTM